ncbi:uncharacterized protein LOC131860407 [Cryptomeria japonica]|uniref:uncharacterized protein LOC131860407 n=1 Tax=Cryptomeria japonica TaxID=3369 RepID=UPI0027D9E2BA|nr:uncharacterized protein LOC131860407 [Cryptomeria japonica]
MDIIQTALPQSTDSTTTIAVSLKRRLEYKNAFQKGMVRPNLIMQALFQLSSTPLYKLQNVQINKDWQAIVQHNSNNQETIQTNNTDTDTDSDMEQEQPSETLIHGFTESRCIHQMQDKILEIAPAQDNCPIGIFQDKYAEEMNFPTLFFGSARDDDITKRFTYQKIAQWELLTSHRQFAYHTTNLFFKTVKVLIQQVISTMWVRIRKGQLKGKKLIAKDVKEKPNLERMLKSNIGYIDFKRIRISPDYTHQLKKNVFAMIRQLGPPTFFLTFTSAEQNWEPLMTTLQQLHDLHYSKVDEQRDITQIGNHKFQLIKKDPVTCARYYRHRINAMKKLILSDNSFFGDISDYFSVTEFQNRGNEHDHFLIWTKDAPIYGKATTTDIVQFVDKYITCSTEHLDNSLANLHKHHHTKQCRRNKKTNCRYNFPFPPMQNTMILEPLLEKNEKIMSNSTKIYSTLQIENYDASCTVQDFLDEIQITEDQYILALRSTIQRPTLLLQRKPSQIWNNSFAKQMPLLWNANTDAQFILNAYAAAMYCSSYIAKVDKSMTQAFNKIRKEHQHENIDAIQMIKKLGNALLNLQQMSSQQAAHIVLSLPLNKSSRKCIFIDTRPDDERTFILKPPKQLRKELDDSEDIICKSLMHYYIQRPPTITAICLAEFVATYNKDGTKIKQKAKPNIIRFINYNKHIDIENYCREKLVLYVPFTLNETTLKDNFLSWESAYTHHEKTILKNCAKFTFTINPTWGDLDKAINELDTENPNDVNDVHVPNTFNEDELYDIGPDINKKSLKTTDTVVHGAFEIAKHTQIIDNNEYHKLRQMLNIEQQAIVKDIAIKKMKNMQTPLHLFLTGGAGTGKTFTAKAIYQTLLRLYSASIDNDPDKPKGLLTAYTGKAAFNVGGTTLHSTFHIPFNKSNFVPLSTDTLDTMSKHFSQLRILLIDEISLVGSTFLRYIDKRLRDIMQTPTTPFGGLDTIFCGDLYQALPVLDSIIFENKPTATDLLPYNFWIDNVKCYPLTKTMRQKDETFIYILNKMRVAAQTSDDIDYLNQHCLKQPPVDPTLPHLFYRKVDVHNHNNKMLTKLPGETIVLNALDEQETNIDTIRLYDHTTTLPSEIHVKPNILVEIYAGNYNTQDGLVNGSDGIFKIYTKHNHIDIIWIDFNDPTVGIQQRKKLAPYYNPTIQTNWTPILPLRMQQHTTIAPKSEIMDKNTSKRSKINNEISLSIDDLNARKAGNNFQGDVLVIYKATLDKVNKTREVLRAYLTDLKGEMTITLTVSNNLLHKFEDKIIVGMGLSISDFDVVPRTDYDRGDCDCVLLLKDTSTLQVIPRILHDYNFIPNTTIRHLLNNTSDYPIGTIGALVVAAKRSGVQYTLEIKDAHNDNAQLWMNANFTQHYLEIENKLQSNELPQMLFKNIVKRTDLKNAFRTGIATFICTLKDKRTLQKLTALMESTNKVTGKLTITNAFSNPFIASCTACKYKFDTFGLRLFATISIRTQQMPAATTFIA